MARPIARVLWLAVTAATVTAMDCDSPVGPTHEIIAGPLVTAYTQARIQGIPVEEISREGVSGQDKGRLCLFGGGRYSYWEGYWYRNHTPNDPDEPEGETFYGTYGPGGPDTLILVGRLHGAAKTIVDTLSVYSGSAKFTRTTSATIVAECESSR